MPFDISLIDINSNSALW